MPNRSLRLFIFPRANQTLRSARLRGTTDEDLLKIGKDVGKLAENPCNWKKLGANGSSGKDWENGNEKIRCRAALLFSTSPLSWILFPIP
jgi:hypothetical protein